jgi:hypothetical protein
MFPKTWRPTEKNRVNDFTRICVKSKDATKEDGMLIC